MKVLFITRNYPPMIGGMESYSYDLYTSLSKHLDIDIWAHRKSKKWLPLFLVSIFIRILLYGRRYDHIHFGDGVLSPFAILARIVGCKGVTLTVHALDITYSDWIYQLLIPRCLQRVHRIVCVSDYAREQCEARGISRTQCIVIPNGIRLVGLTEIDANECRPLLNRLIPDNKTVLLSICRLVPRKGLAWFIAEVMPRLSKEHYLIIGGIGPQKATLDKLIQDYHLSGRVRLLGRIDERIKSCLYQAADLYVMPNIEIEGDAEGFGISLIEAGAYGLPSIASDLQGIRSAVINNETGLLVESENADAFINGIYQCRLDKVKVKSMVRKKYDWDVLAKHYIHLFDDLTSKSF